ncbi:hypothetical protein [Isoptericola sp. NPDC019571]|uniref:hypothetical protein n=1 Tax=Isoptericola sp. NPDC019571 TaxID=3364008 RepID=UPI00379B8A57
MSRKSLRPDGHVEWRPDPATVSRATGAGRYVISEGQLCTACLVGDWPMSMFRFSQTLCDACRALDGEVTRRAGLDEGPRAGRLVGGSGRIGGLHDPYDSDWEPVRQALAYRQARLASVFVRARALGIVRLEEGLPGTAPRELVGYDDLRAYALVPDAMPDRVRRYADWLQALDPTGHAVRDRALSDVDSLADWLRRRERYVRRARARAELDRTARVTAQVPRDLARAIAGVLKAARARSVR